MIEGLRCLPFTADLPIFDCDKCLNGEKRNDVMIMQPQSIHARRSQACGYLPRDPAVKVPWGIPPGLPFVPSCCPGYLTGLPEVQEAVRIRPQWLKGGAAAVREYLGEDANSDLGPANDGQACLDGAVTTKQNWDTEQRAKAAEANRGH